VVNNITYQNAWNSAFDLYDECLQTVPSKNLVNQDPRFVKAAAQDFRLQVGSPGHQCGADAEPGGHGLCWGGPAAGERLRHRRL
jgi:hypothetical protein